MVVNILIQLIELYENLCQLIKMLILDQFLNYGSLLAAMPNFKGCAVIFGIVSVPARKGNRSV